MKRVFLFLSVFFIFSCDGLERTIVIANLTSRGYISELTCNGYSFFLYQGDGNVDSLDDLEMTFQPGQRREFWVPDSIRDGDLLEWEIVFYHKKIDGYFAYPERVEVQTESGVFFGNGDWLDLTDDTEVYSRATVSAAYLSDLLGGKTVSISVRNETPFSFDEFRIGDHPLAASDNAPDFLGPDSSETWNDAYNTVNGRVRYLSFRVTDGDSSKRVRMNRPLWFGESLQVTLRKATAVIEVDGDGHTLSSEPVLLERIFDPLP